MSNMEARGLIRAQIMTLKGNVVWRWVKPDNPNIVNHLNKAVDKLEASVKEVKPKIVGYATEGWSGCCGAQFYTPVFAVEAKSPEEWEKSWKASPWYERYNAHLKASEQYRGRSVSDVRYFQAQATKVSLDAYIKAFGVTKGPVVKTPELSPGICVSTFDFKGATELLPGIWGRKDVEPVNKAKDDFFDPVKQLTRLPATKGCRPCNVWVPDPENTKIRILTGLREIGLGANIWATLKPGKPARTPNIFDRTKTMEYTPWEVGDTVLFIANNLQRNSHGHTIPEDLAAKGFKELLRTGNSVHSGTSTIYLYGRTLTDKDVELLNAQ